MMLRECEGDVKEVLRGKHLRGNLFLVIQLSLWMILNEFTVQVFLIVEFLRNGPSKEFWDDWSATGNVYRKGFTWG